MRVAERNRAVAAGRSGLRARVRVSAIGVRPANPVSVRCTIAVLGGRRRCQQQEKQKGFHAEMLHSPHRRKSMKRTCVAAFIALLLCLSLPSVASKKEAPVYQDAVLKDFHMVEAGKFCTTNGNTSGLVDSNGNNSGTISATTSSTTSCRPRTSAVYTVISGVHTMTLTPHQSGGKTAAKVGTAFITLGIGTVVWNSLEKNSALYGVLPGTAIKMRSDEGIIYVKVGKRESTYSIVSMQ